jgi:hypothetical protein
MVLNAFTWLAEFCIPIKLSLLRALLHSTHLPQHLHRQLETFPLKPLFFSRARQFTTPLFLAKLRLKMFFLTWESSKQASNDFGTMPLDPFSDADNFVHLFGVLQQLHQHDIVHSDIRLPNIVFSPPPPSSSQSQSPSQSSSPSHPMMSLVDLEYGLPKAQLDANRELVDSLYQHLKTTQSFRWFTDIARTLLFVSTPIPFSSSARCGKCTSFATTTR